MLMLIPLTSWWRKVAVLVLFPQPICALFCFLNTPITAVAQSVESEIDTLIDRLQEVTALDSVEIERAGFLPLPLADDSNLQLDQEQEPNPIRRLVALGPRAVPSLLKHVDDQRPTGIEIDHSSKTEGLFLADYYDHNSLTIDTPPPGVNLIREEARRVRINSYELTVGDLCFTALGQILNRRYCPIYSPMFPEGEFFTGVSSASANESLANAVRDEWSKLDAASHKQSLIGDFQKPDYEHRRFGAYLRLCCYYPDAVEELVLEVLTEPIFDSSLAVQFCRNDLYEADNEQRRQSFNEFIERNGKAYLVGVEDYLFHDLYLLEASERGSLSGGPLPFNATEPRDLLVLLYDAPKNIKSDDRPKREVVSESDRAKFIRSLVHLSLIHI